MAEYVAGSNYTYQDYEWLYNNAHKYTLAQLCDITGRGMDSIHGHVARLGFRSVNPLPAQIRAIIKEYASLGDALIFLLPDVPLQVIREVLNEA